MISDLTCIWEVSSLKLFKHNTMKIKRYLSPIYKIKKLNVLRSLDTFMMSGKVTYLAMIKLTLFY